MEERGGGGGGGGVAGIGTDRQKTSAQPPGNCEAHMVLSWYGGNE